MDVPFIIPTPSTTPLPNINNDNNIPITISPTWRVTLPNGRGVITETPMKGRTKANSPKMPDDLIFSRLDDEFLVDDDNVMDADIGMDDNQPKIDDDSVDDYVGIPTDDGAISYVINDLSPTAQPIATPPNVHASSPIDDDIRPTRTSEQQSSNSRTTTSPQRISPSVPSQKKPRMTPTTPQPRSSRTPPRTIPTTPSNSISEIQPIFHQSNHVL